MNRNIIFVDGECILCNKFLNHVNKIDSSKYYYYSTIQSELCQKLIKREKIDRLGIDSVILYDKNILYYKSDAISKILSRFSFKWKIISFILRIIPRFIKNGIYDLIAKYRFRLFGKKKNCKIETNIYKELII